MLEAAPAPMLAPALMSAVGASTPQGTQQLHTSVAVALSRGGGAAVSGAAGLQAAASAAGGYGAWLERGAAGGHGVGPRRSEDLAAAARAVHAAGLSPETQQVLLSHMRRWPSLSRDPEGLLARARALAQLLGGGAHADAALRALPELMTRVPEAVAAQMDLIGSELGGLDRRSVLQLLPRHPPLLYADAGELAARRQQVGRGPGGRVPGLRVS